MPGQVFHVVERSIHELSEAERKALKRQARSRLGLRKPSRLPERGRDYDQSR